MAAFESTAKLSRKGQLTLPKRVREVLGTAVVRIVVAGHAVRIEPVGDLAGSLRTYANPGVTHRQGRDQAWEAAVREKHGRR